MRRGPIFNDTTAVSSVIGIILVVAITVILAAVIATFALGFGEKTEAAPPAKFSGEQSPKHLVATGSNNADFWSLTITYESGQSIDQERVDVRVNGEKAFGVENTSGSSCSAPECHEAVGVWDSSDKVEAGDKITVVHKNDSSISAGDRYDICSSTNMCPGDEPDDPDTSRLWANSEATSGPLLQLNEDDTVRIVWESRSGDTTAILYEETID